MTTTELTQVGGNLLKFEEMMTSHFLVYVGIEVDLFAQVGAQSGVGTYATIGGNQKANGDSLSYHNSQLYSEHVTPCSAQDMSSVGMRV